jgi:hypothetical protein
MGRRDKPERGRQAILTAEKLPALHAAVMAACADKNGVIQDPRACAFDPVSIRCKDADRPDCLTEAEIKVVREEYRGPHDAQGHNLFDGGEPYGSELAWALWLVMPAADVAAPGDTIAAGFAGVYNATSPDLEAFRAHGGKIIIYHSWADQAIPPFATIDYYRAVANQMGGYEPIQSFSRLYMIPGLYHCPCGQPVDGDPATTVQLMPQLSNWVEHGDIVLPVTAQSTGEHLTELTVSPFDPLKPAPQNNGLNSNYDYIGATSDYQKRNQLWCTWDGPRLTCSPPT